MEKKLDLCKNCEHRVVCQGTIERILQPMFKHLKLLGITDVTLMVDRCKNYKNAQSKPKE